MSKGPCSGQAREVVHQYVNNFYWLDSSVQGNQSDVAATGDSQQHLDTVVQSVSSAPPNPHAATPSPEHNAATHVTPSPSSVIDIYNDSCLNGWTMGNIAATASDISRFYAHLATGRLVTERSLSEMTTWHNLSFNGRSDTLPGARPGTPYGLGLFTLSVRLWIDSAVTSCGTLPFCECDLQGPAGATCVFDVSVHINSQLAACRQRQGHRHTLGIHVTSLAPL
jgi:hypothetical protein